MRRTLLCLSLVLAVSGCSSMKDLFSAHAGVAAKAAGHTLTADSLATILLEAKGARVTPETAEFLANLWVDYELFGHAAAAGLLKSDSAAVVAVLWPQITETIGMRWHDSLLARRTSFTPASFDSAYSSTDSNAVRVLQHLLVRVDQNATDAVRAAAQKKIAGILARVRGGADFAALARQYTDDRASQATGGVMNAAPRGAYVTPFDSAGWLLKPGEISGIVTSPYGYHVIRRPRFAEVQPQIKQWMEYQAGNRLDSLYMDSLAHARHLDVKSNAAAKLRGGLEDLEDSRTSTTALASYDGGKLTLGEALKWTSAMPPQLASQLQSATDTQMAGFVHAIAQNTLLLEDARHNGADLTPAEYAELRGSYVAMIDTLRGVLGLTASVLDSSASAADRETAAANQIAAYFAKLLSRNAPARAIPGPMSSYLRDRVEHSVNLAGVNRAVEIALTRRDSAQATTPATGPSRATPPLPSGMTPVPSTPAPGSGH